MEVTHEPLERPQPGVGLFQKLLVNADGLADLSLLLVALGLPHLGGQTRHLGAIIFIKGGELLEGLLQVFRPVGRFLGIGLCEFILGDGLLKLGVQECCVNFSTFLEPRIALGDESGVALVGLIELLHGVRECRARLGKRGAGLTLPERFLGRVLGVVGEQQCQVPALDQHPRHPAPWLPAPGGGWDEP